MTEQEGLVSVIMPACDRAHLISYAIESVLDQSYPNLELILVDDASRDETLSVMQAYHDADRRVTVIQNPKNSRLGPIQWEPRNDGLRVAQGEFIAYLDSDNTWDPHFLQVMVRALQTSPELMLAHCDSVNHYENIEQMKAVLASDIRRQCNLDDLTITFSYEDFVRDQMGFEIYIDTNEILHRTSIFEGLGALWSTFHPRRMEINAAQALRRAYRRHNDLHLVERVIDHFGEGSLYHVREPLIDFYYHCRPRPIPMRRLPTASLGASSAGAAELADVQ